MAEYMSDRELIHQLRNLSKEVQEKRRMAALQREEMATHVDMSTQPEHIQRDIPRHMVVNSVVDGEGDIGNLSFEGSPSYQDQVRRDIAQQAVAVTSVDRRDLRDRSFEILTSQKGAIDLDYSYRTIDEFGFRDAEKLNVSSIIDDIDAQPTRIEEFSSLDRETRRLTNIMKDKESVQNSRSQGDNTVELSQFLDRHQQAVDQTWNGDTNVKELPRTRQHVAEQIHGGDIPVKVNSLPKPRSYENSATSDIHQRQYIGQVVINKTTSEIVQNSVVADGVAEGVLPPITRSKQCHISDQNAVIDDVQAFAQPRTEKVQTYRDYIQKSINHDNSLTLHEERKKEFDAREKLKRLRLLKEEEELRVRQKLLDEWNSKNLELQKINEESRQRNKQLEMERLAQKEKQEKMEIQRQLKEKEENRLKKMEENIRLEKEQALEKTLQEKMRLQIEQEMETHRNMLEERERLRRLKRDQDIETQRRLSEDRERLKRLQEAEVRRKIKMEDELVQERERNEQIRIQKEKEMENIRIKVEKEIRLEAEERIRKQIEEEEIERKQREQERMRQLEIRNKQLEEERNRHIEEEVRRQQLVDERRKQQLVEERRKQQLAEERRKQLEEERERHIEAEIRKKQLEEDRKKQVDEEVRRQFENERSGQIPVRETERLRMERRQKWLDEEKELRQTIQKLKEEKSVVDDEDKEIEERLLKLRKERDALQSKTDTGKRDEQKVSQGPGAKPKLPNFDGSNFEEWKLEVTSLMETKLYTDHILTQHVRGTISGTARKVLLTLKPSASSREIMKKMEDIYGNIQTGESIIRDFYAAKQEKSEPCSEWGVRLETLFYKAVDRGEIDSSKKDSKLKERFWRGLVNEKIKIATRNVYESADNFDLLRNKARLEELEISSEMKSEIPKPEVEETKQCQAVQTPNTETNSKLDELLKKIASLEVDLKELKAKEERRDTASRGGYHQSRGRYSYRGNYRGVYNRGSYNWRNRRDDNSNSRYKEENANTQQKKQDTDHLNEKESPSKG